MTATQRKAVIVLASEFAIVFASYLTMVMLGVIVTTRLGIDNVSAFDKLRVPAVTIAHIIVPMIVCFIATMIVVKRRGLGHVVWREPEFVPPELGGKAPTYAPPLDTDDDFFGSALSSEPEPFYQLNVQPRVSRLWWLLGSLMTLGALLAIIHGAISMDATLTELLIGTLGAITWALAQEYLLRGLLVAEARRFARRDRWALATSLIASAAWVLPLATTAETDTRVIVLLLLAVGTAIPSFALRRMFTTLWAPVIGNALFITAFFVLG